MAWIKCMIPSETDSTEDTLWTNDSPTKSFSGKTVTLSESIFNYSLIKITGRGRATNTTPKWETIVTPQYLANCVNSISTKGCACLITCSINISTGRQGRLVTASADGLSITFTADACLGTNESSNNNFIVPEEIIGII